MKTSNKLCLPLLITLSLTAGTASAAAAPEEEAPAPWPPEDTGGRYLPVPDDYYAPFEVQACGSTVTIASGDVREVRYKSRVKRDGSTVVKFRGDSTVDLTRASDGAFIDELDVSGRGSQRISADQRTVVESFKGPSIVYPISPADAAALAEEGFPEFFYFEHGKLSLELEFQGDPTAVGPTSVEVLMNTAMNVRDVCDMLDEAAERA